MSSRTSFSPFGSALGLAAIVFAGGMAFLFSFGYLDMNTDNRSDASSAWCQEKGGYMETSRRGRFTGRCLCANGQTVGQDATQNCRTVSPGFEDPNRPQVTPSGFPVTKPFERPAPGYPVVKPIAQ